MTIYLTQTSTNEYVADYNDESALAICADNIIDAYIDAANIFGIENIEMSDIYVQTEDYKIEYLEERQQLLEVIFKSGNFAYLSQADLIERDEYSENTLTAEEESELDIIITSLNDLLN